MIKTASLHSRGHVGSITVNMLHVEGASIGKGYISVCGGGSSKN